MASSSKQLNVEQVADIQDSYHQRMTTSTVEWGGVSFKLRPLTVAALAWSQSNEAGLRGHLQLQFCLAEVTGCEVEYETVTVDGEDYQCVTLAWINKQLPGLVKALIEECSRRAGLHHDERVKLDFT
jgi:hypothetical protein